MLSDDTIDDDDIIEETPANTPKSNDDCSDDVVLNAIKTIVRATNNPFAARATIQLLHEKLKKSLNGDIYISDENREEDDGDGNNSISRRPNDDDVAEDNDDGSDVEEILKVATYKVSSTKRTEHEKWKELLVNTNHGRR